MVAEQIGSNLVTHSSTQQSYKQSLWATVLMTLDLFLGSFA